MELSGKTAMNFNETAAATKTLFLVRDTTTKTLRDISLAGHCEFIPVSKIIKGCLYTRLSFT